MKTKMIKVSPDTHQQIKKQAKEKGIHMMKYIQILADRDKKEDGKKD